MKFIESLELCDLNLLLTSKNIGICTIDASIEAFDFSDEFNSSNQSSSEKEEDVIAIGSGNIQNLALEFSAPSSSMLNNLGGGRKRSNSVGSFSVRRGASRKGRSSSLGDLNEPSNQKLFINLIATMTEIFPDYDFQSVKASQFTLQEISSVMRNVNSYLAELNLTHPLFLNRLWQSLDLVVNIHRCEVYSFTPKLGDDELFSEGSVWSFYYFFFNKDNMRIASFTCIASANNRINSICDPTFEEDEDNCYDDSFDDNNSNSPLNDSQIMDEDFEETADSDDENLPDWFVH